MKNKLLIILLLISATLFSQDKDKKSLLEEMNNYYNKSKIEKLEELTDDLLSGKYGSMDDELKFYALMYSSNVFSRDEYAKKDPQKGYDKLFEVLLFAKNTSYAIPNKEAYLKSMSDYLITYKNKHPEVKESVKEIENNAVAGIKAETENKTNEINTTETNLTSKTTSDNKTVTLTVSGTGKTLEEARLNALRSAIEQAFGAFISSKTEILNDNLVKDEIVSISNGNIQKYDIVSQVEIPDNGYSITLNATVSLDKLTSFVESKGVVVEYKGGMFGLKIKLQKLNEEAEIVAIKNLTSTCFDILSSSIDFKLYVSEPKVSENDENIYLVDFLINTSSNKNYENFVNYFTQTLSKISLSLLEKEDYIKLNKPVYELKIDDKFFYLRTLESFKYLCAFYTISPIYNTTFKIYSNIDTVKFNFVDLFGDYYSDIRPVLNVKTYYNNNRNSPENLHRYFNNYIKYDIIKSKSDLLYNTSLLEYNPGIDLFNFKTPKDFFTDFQNISLKFTKEFNISDLEKINEFKLDKIEINDFLKNRNLYMLIRTDVPKIPSSATPAK